MNKLKKWLKKYWGWLTGVLLLIGLLCFLFWPLSSVVEAPGEAVSIQPMVRIQGVKPLKKNKFMITAVSMSQAHPVSYLYAKFDPHLTISSSKDVKGSQSDQEFQNVQNIYMNSAISNATYVAYKKANRPVKRAYHGVYVLNVFPHSSFAKKLKPGDLVESVNGKILRQGPEYVKYIQSLPKHAKLTIKFKRDGKEHVVIGRKTKMVKGFYGIGIGMTDDVTVTEKPKIDINPGKIGGPSGGLMFALQVYTQLTGKTYPIKNIAGTGMIGPNGQVGEIGGVDKKIIAANKSGAQVFFCPYVKPTKTALALEDGHKTNYQVAKATAKKYAPKMKVVPVSTFNQALKYLNEKHS